MSSPAPHTPNGNSRESDNLNGHASPEAGPQVATEEFRRARSTLLTIGVAATALLVVGGAAGVWAIAAGAAVPSTTAIVVVAASVVVALATVISAVVTAGKAHDAAVDAVQRAEADRRPAASAPASRPAAPTVGDVARQSTTGALREPSARQQPQSPEVFSRIASRLQAKVARAFVDLDGLERRIEDPELLAIVFRLDHLVTRIRREVENLSVLGGDVPQPRSMQPAEVNQVLRLAVASTEDYQRIMTFPLRGVKIQGHVVAELINLLAELLDNATAFTPPQAPKIALTASRVAAGLAIEVHDRGIGMPPEDIDRVNRLLAGYADVDLHQLLDEGRVGFAVVNKLAPRHNIRVQLRTNIFGGIDAAVVIPHNLISEPEELYGSPNGQGTVRLESGAHRGPSRVPARSQGQPAAPQAPDWQFPGETDEGSTDLLPTGAHAVQTAAPAPVASTPSPFPRASAERDSGPVTLRAVPTVPEVAQVAMGAHAQPAERPPLPQRGAETYLRPELRQRPQVARVSPGHNPDLLVEVMRGRDDAEIDNSDGGR
jgi:signal transduction histidine kinase